MSSGSSGVDAMTAALPKAPPSASRGCTSAVDSAASGGFFSSDRRSPRQTIQLSAIGMGWKWCGISLRVQRTKHEAAGGTVQECDERGMPWWGLAK